MEAVGGQTVQYAHICIQGRCVRCAKSRLFCPFLPGMSADVKISLGDIQNPPNLCVSPLFGIFFTIFAPMCGSEDTPPCFEGGELKKSCFGRYLDGYGWVSGPIRRLEGRKIGHDIILLRLLKIGNLGTKLVT